MSTSQVGPQLLELGSALLAEILETVDVLVEELLLLRETLLPGGVEGQQLADARLLQCPFCFCVPVCSWGVPPDAAPAPINHIPAV